MARVFEARYYGTCASCFERIEPGDDITYEDDELVHEDCATSEWVDPDDYWDDPDD